jgi:hypothetical protein
MDHWDRPSAAPQRTGLRRQRLQSDRHLSPMLAMELAPCARLQVSWDRTDQSLAARAQAGPASLTGKRCGSVFSSIKKITLGGFPYRQALHLAGN